MKIMDSLMKVFIEYAEYDEIGDLTGISNDAPDYAKKAYDDFKNLMETAEKSGVRI